MLCSEPKSLRIFATSRRCPCLSEALASEELSEAGRQLTGRAGLTRLK